MNRKSFLVHLTEYLCLSLMVLGGLTACSRPDTVRPVFRASYRAEAVDSIVVSRLCENKIVMFGDAAHGHRYYYRLVLDILDEWLSRINVRSKQIFPRDAAPRFPLPDNTPSRLILFIEADTNQANVINTFIATGNIDPYASWWIDLTGKWSGVEQFTVDRLEFLYGLRNVRRRIDSLNRTGSNQPIDLLVKGPESNPPYDWKEKWTRKDFDEQIGLPWFAHVRDRQIADNVVRILAEHPDYKALMFYGTGHLVRAETDKSPAGRRASDRSLVDYYAAHFLDKRFGRDSVCVVTCGALTRGDPQAGELVEFYPSANGPDFVLKTVLTPPAPFPVLMADSRRMLHLGLDFVGDYSGRQGDYEQSAAINELRMLTWQLQRSTLSLNPHNRSALDTVLAIARNFESFARGKDRAMAIISNLISEYDPVGTIDQVEKWFFPAEKAQQIFYGRAVSMVLANLPSDTIDVPESAETMNPVKWNELKECLLIGLLWTGTHEEQQGALGDLRRRTGKNFEIPAGWRTGSTTP